MAISDYASDQLNYVIGSMVQRSRESLIRNVMKSSLFDIVYSDYSRHVGHWNTYQRQLELRALDNEYGKAVSIGPTPYDHDDY